jgi:hypothetical protein
MPLGSLRCDLHDRSMFRRTGARIVRHSLRFSTPLTSQRLEGGQAAWRVSSAWLREPDTANPQVRRHGGQDNPD